MRTIPILAASIVALAGVLAGGAGLAADRNGEFFSRGLGIATCQKYLDDKAGNTELYLYYRSWLNGYVVSGYCSEWNAGKFRLLRKLKFENTSFDGYHAELWEVAVPLAEDRDVVLYGIVFPDALNTLGGARP